MNSIPTWVLYFFAVFGFASMTIGFIIVVMGVLFIKRDSDRITAEYEKKNGLIRLSHERKRRGLDND